MRIRKIIGASALAGAGFLVTMAAPAFAHVKVEPVDRRQGRRSRR